MRELLAGRILGPLAAALGTGDSELRAALVGSQVVGIVMARYVVGVETLAGLEPEELVDALAPTFQRYLVDDL
jgi:hypothetical protein